MSSQIDRPKIVEILFSRIRKRFQLGIGELEAALDAVMNNWGNSDLDLQRVLRLLWCHSEEDRVDFDSKWAELIKELDAQHQPREKSSDPKTKDLETDKDTAASQDSMTTQTSVTSPPPTTQSLGVLPTQAPPVSAEAEEEIWNKLPVNRRSMAYGWRNLRRLRADGRLDVVDVPATIAQAARQGFYAAPVFKRRTTNHARLLLLIDRDGSMVPFHRFIRDLVQTAQEDCDLEQIHLQEIQVAYFYNVPQEYVYADEHLTKPIELQPLLKWCDRETSVLIVSDGGAARGNRRIERIRATTKFLANLRTYTNLVSWLNPVPQERWESTSAELLAYIVPMEVMNEDGFKIAIDLVRG
jgi:uncharacterized protein